MRVYPLPGFESLAHRHLKSRKHYKYSAFLHFLLLLPIPFPILLVSYQGYRHTLWENFMDTEQKTPPLGALLASLTEGEREIVLMYAAILIANRKAL